MVADDVDVTSGLLGQRISRTTMNRTVLDKTTDACGPL